ncbi:hypothetical protein SKAU_G00292380 [Synaphobranchus kaupii]|uniref:Uncharacterized protein n=1 Tax=Synaphobranchus kaupii TaxID=118154 RepID=A0A9Q1EU56_SYNKA|nr:hypothetical protein SKAU_G00292380 [Synaphobranchus kaupii]
MITRIGVPAKQDGFTASESDDSPLVTGGGEIRSAEDANSGRRARGTEAPSGIQGSVTAVVTQGPRRRAGASSPQTRGINVNVFDARPC